MGPGDDLQEPGQVPSHRAALIVAGIVVVVFQLLVPYGKLLLYPLTLLSTWIHEMGHGVTALLCGGRFDQLLIYPDASGLSQTAVPPGICEALAAVGGLLAPPFVGFLCLALGRRHPRVILGGLALAMAASLVLYVRTLAGQLSVLPLSCMLALSASYGAPEGRLFMTQLIGVVLGLDTITRTLGYLFVTSTSVWGSQQASDIAGIADILGGPYKLWGALIAALALFMLSLGFWVAWRTSSTRRDVN